MRFCDYLRQRRELSGLAQKDIAEVLSVDVPMYSRYERGLRPLKEGHIPIIASILNVDSVELRKMWIADKVLSVVNEEEDAGEILSIVVENINDRKVSDDRN